MFCLICSYFFFNDTATTEIYTLSLHDALPIWPTFRGWNSVTRDVECWLVTHRWPLTGVSQVERARIMKQNLCSVQPLRSEEHTSELQSRQYLVCRLLLEKKKKKSYTNSHTLQY